MTEELQGLKSEAHGMLTGAEPRGFHPLPAPLLGSKVIYLGNKEKDVTGDGGNVLRKLRKTP